MSSNKKVNKLSIIALIVSIFSVIFGTILAFIAISEIKKTEEKGKGIAYCAIIINIMKVISVIIIAVLLMFSPSHTENEYKCKHAKSCEDTSAQTYTCIYDNDGVEEYITCENKTQQQEKEAQKEITEDDEDSLDTFDYDKEY